MQLTTRNSSIPIAPLFQQRSTFRFVTMGAVPNYAYANFVLANLLRVQRLEIKQEQRLSLIDDRLITCEVILSMSREAPTITPA